MGRQWCNLHRFLPMQKRWSELVLVDTADLRSSLCIHHCEVLNVSNNSKSHSDLPLIGFLLNRRGDHFKDYLLAPNGGFWPIKKGMCSDGIRRWPVPVRLSTVVSALIAKSFLIYPSIISVPSKKNRLWSHKLPFVVLKQCPSLWPTGYSLSNEL